MVTDNMLVYSSESPSAVKVRVKSADAKLLLCFSHNIN